MIIALLLAFSARAASTEQVVDSWLAGQTNIQTWHAAFTQTRTLKALKQPLVSTGQVWFAAPQNFRWELGEGQTIALRKDDLMMVVYPKVKHVEKYDFSSLGAGQWKDTLALLQAGFPRSRQEIDQQFKVVSAAETNNLQQLTLQPKSAQARKMMPAIKIYLDTKQGQLAGTELIFADGSSMRNDFSSIQTNVTIDPEVFSTKLPVDFKVTEPLKKR